MANFLKSLESALENVRGGNMVGVPIGDLRELIHHYKRVDDDMRALYQRNQDLEQENKELWAKVNGERSERRSNQAG